MSERLNFVHLSVLMRIKTLNGALPEVLKAQEWDKKISDGKGNQFLEKERNNLFLTEKHCITVRKTLA